MRNKLSILTTILAAALLGVWAFSQDDPTPAVPEAETPEALEARLASGEPGWHGMAFIGGGDRNKVWVVDARFRELVAMFEPDIPKNERTQPNYPNIWDVHAMVFSKDFSVFYTVVWSDYDEPSHVIAYDPLTFQELWRTEAGLGGHHAALTPDDRFLYVANQYADTVSVIDTQTRQKVTDITTGFGNDYITPSMYWDGIAIDTPYLFVSVHQGGHEETGTVYAIDWRNHEVVEEIVIGGMVHGVNLTPDGSHAWAAVMGLDMVVVIDTETFEVVHRIEMPGSPIHLSFSPDGEFVYFTTTGDKLYKYDTETYEEIWSATGTSIPAHTGVTPDGEEFWTLNHAMSQERYPYSLGGAITSGVQVWDTETGRLIDEFVAEGTPHEIQFVPYSAVRPTPAAADEDESELAVRGREIVGQVCFACHGNNLEGASGPDLRTVGERLTQDEIFDVLMHGRGSMPANLLSAEDAELMAEWLAGMTTEDDSGHGDHDDPGEPADDGM